MRIINTTAFVVALVLVLAYYFFSVRKWKAQNNKNVITTEMISTNGDDVSVAIAIGNENCEEGEELFAIITAAIHEFTGSTEFEVVKIRASADNWRITGRQNALRNGY